MPLKNIKRHLFEIIKIKYKSRNLDFYDEYGIRIAFFVFFVGKIKFGDTVMQDISNVSLEQVVDNSDPGDDTGRRYRYQWTYAAILCCALMDETLDFCEVFCEHFEDILIKHDDGKFSGYQVKTRANDQPIWKSNDPLLLSALRKFISTNHNHPDSFRCFYFLTNHPIYFAQNGMSILYIIDIIKQSNALSDITGPYAKYIATLAKETNCSQEAVYSALKKTQVKDNLPKLPDANMRLISTLMDNWDHGDKCTLSDIKRVAETLIEECQKASTLTHYDALPAYIDALPNGEDIELKARIDGKRIDKKRLADLLQQGLSNQIPLHIDPEKLVTPGEGQVALLEQKLDAGGFSVISINSAKDLRDRADYYGTKLIYKNGRELGLQKYNELRSLVLRDAANSFETVKRNDPFGKEMLSELRNSFKLHYEEGDDLHGCKSEHLEGLAYSLTSQCKIQWSVNRPWEDK